MQDEQARRRFLSEQNISQLLRIPYQAFIRRLHAELSAAGYPDIRPSHGVVFQHLRAEGSRLTDLADRAMITKQSMGYLVDYLEARGYLERVPDPADSRAKLVRMTEQGWELTRVAEGIIARIEADWAQRCGRHAFERLRSLLQDLILTVDEP
jgi:DNA-binding MarR family transcriptional regulator